MSIILQGLDKFFEFSVKPLMLYYSNSDDDCLVDVGQYRSCVTQTLQRGLERRFKALWSSNLVPGRYTNTIGL